MIKVFEYPLVSQRFDHLAVAVVTWWTDVSSASSSSFTHGKMAGWNNPAL